jgi:hypothetical protein
MSFQINVQYTSVPELMLPYCCSPSRVHIKSEVKYNYITSLDTDAS